MAGSLSGSLFSGGSSIGLGGFLDDLFGETEDVAGDTTSATTGGSTPKTTDATVIPGTASSKAKHSDGALPKFGTCPADMIDDPLNPQNFCVPKPGKNFACPVGQIYDYPKQGCVKMTGGDTMVGPNGVIVGTMCPYGTKKVGQACVSMVGTGVPTLGSKTVDPTTIGGGNPAINTIGGTGGVPTWAIALAGVGVVAIVGGAIYAKSKDGKKKGGRR